MRRMGWMLMGVLGIYSAGFAHGLATVYRRGPEIGARLQQSGAWLSGMGTVQAVTATSPAATQLAELARAGRLEPQAPAVVVEYRSPSAGKPIAGDWGKR
jgi:hypothetical protein